jgi:hypothetical protein
MILMSLSIQAMLDPHQNPMGLLRDVGTLAVSAAKNGTSDTPSMGHLKKTVCVSVVVVVVVVVMAVCVCV